MFIQLGLFVTAHSQIPTEQLISQAVDSAAPEFQSFVYVECTPSYAFQIILSTGPALTLIWSQPSKVLSIPSSFYYTLAGSLSTCYRDSRALNLFLRS